jgi:hypothetical protein
MVERLVGSQLMRVFSQKTDLRNETSASLLNLKLYGKFKTGGIRININRHYISLCGIKKLPVGLHSSGDF